MKLLVLGGTRFLGPAIVEAALERKHTVTLFNRGRSNPELFPDVEKLRGDRDGKLEALQGRRWDAVIDTSGYVPRIVKMSAELLAPNVRQYVFISSISVYPDLQLPGIEETHPVATMPDESNEEVRKHYGALKALSEQAAESAMPGRVANVRPGLIVGPRDGSDRFTYWPARVNRGGEVLAPGFPEARVQFIDVRDLGSWCVRLVEDGHAGVFNATGPRGTLTMQEFLHGIKAVTANVVGFTWVAEKFLLDHGVAPWTELPLWIPKGEGEFGWVSIERALAHGLTFRSLADTVRATLDWHATRGPDYEFRMGMSAEKEKKILAAWHRRDKQEKKL